MECSTTATEPNLTSPMAPFPKLTFFGGELGSNGWPPAFAWMALPLAAQDGTVIRLLHH